MSASHSRLRRLDRLSARRLSTLATLATLGLAPALLGACHSSGTGAGNDPPASAQRSVGQSDYLSAPLPGQSGGASFGGADGATNSAPVAGPAGGAAQAAAPSAPADPRTVQETDIYRVSGNRLYYLNSYRGLMIFDVTNVDAPQLIGRSPIFGDPQEMLVNGNVAVVVIGDWYGNDFYGAPFHGSIVRGLDCTDPTNIKVVGEAQLGGYVQDTRVVGNVLYTVAQDYGWEYGWEYGWYGYGYYGGGGVDVGTPVAGGAASAPVADLATRKTAAPATRQAAALATRKTAALTKPGFPSSNAIPIPTGPAVRVASINFANGVVQKVGEESFEGYNGVFYVTSSAIMLAHQDLTQANSNGAGMTDIQYVDISDPGGAIRLRGMATVSGAVSGWGPDNGRWNLDFQDGLHAHALGCAQEYCGDDTDTYVLSTVDFTDPDAPTISSEANIPNLGWSAAARFDSGRMYLSPSSYSTSNATTPMYIYDLSNPASPSLAGQANLTGDIWMFIPNDGTSSSTVFALGDTYSASNNYSSDQVQVQYVDVTNASNPQVLNSATFGAGWSWSPVAETFKAFTVDETQGLAVVPFSGWDDNSQSYTNGLQLLQFSPTSLSSSGTARTTGWVERGIFVNNRLISLSDLALSVVDYTNPAAPVVTKEMTLARNVVSAVPQGSTIAELSSDWWGNDLTTSEMRVLPISNAQETTDNGQGTSVSIPGVDANVFNNGTLSYVITTTQVEAPCPPDYGGGTCPVYSQQVQVVDTTNGGAVLRGKITLPNLPYDDGGWGWFGFWYYDWFGGADVVQVGGNALAFRRWYPQYSVAPDGTWTYDASLDALYVVDLSNPDQPNLASLTITDDPTAWWGNMMALGNTLYTTHYEWESKPAPNDPAGTIYYVRYYLDQVDLSNRANPVIGQKINAPGVLVGGSSEDPSLLYFVDYRWDDNSNEHSDIAAAQIVGGKAILQSLTQIDGWVGNVIVQNDKAYMTAQEYGWMLPSDGSGMPYTVLHQLDLTNPSAPVDFVSTDPKNPFGWLLAVDGDRAVVTSGWGPIGVDIYQLSDNAAPAFSQSALSLGWWSNSIARQANTLYLTSGYWGVQAIQLQ